MASRGQLVSGSGDPSGQRSRPSGGHDRASEVTRAVTGHVQIRRCAETQQISVIIGIE